MKVAIIGGGPAGLRAAEVAAAGGATVMLFEAKASVGRKFLVAGRGGLNLTKAEPLEAFVAHYSGPGQPPGLWASLTADFDHEALRAWAAELGIETFVASTKRVYPRELKAAPLLRRWVQRLRDLGVQFATHHRWTGLEKGTRLRLEFLAGDQPQVFVADAVILALGGASWPQTGATGAWTAILKEHGVAVNSLQPANCGWEFPWPEAVLAAVEGQPLKSIVARAGDVEAKGELLVTNYGLEGGAIYQLGSALRAMESPELSIDFKPTFSVAELVARMGPIARNFLPEARQRWRLSDTAYGILANLDGGPFPTPETLAHEVKNCRLRLTGPRPIAEAISSAGGVCWGELNDQLMITRLPGVFVAGEMIDWEAPTGGYLIQGCFATGTRAAGGALEWGRKVEGK